MITTRICPNCNFVFESTAEKDEPRRVDARALVRNDALVRNLANHTRAYIEHNNKLADAQLDSDRHKVAVPQKDV